MVRIRIELGGNGHIRPQDSFSYRSSSSYTTSGDIFYCSGSRQLNHSSFQNSFADTLCSNKAMSIKIARFVVQPCEILTLENRCTDKMLSGKLKEQSQVK